MAAHDKPQFRPLVPGEFRQNSDGSRSTELKSTFEVDGVTILVPTLFIGPDGIQELEGNKALDAALAYENATDLSFPRFDTEEAANLFQSQRLEGVASGPLAQLRRGDKMPGHTPEEKAKNAAARSIQPAPDRQGGSAAVSNDAGSQSTIGRWREFLKRPEVVAGLLQFSAQMLQTNPGGFGPAFGTSLAAGLGAAGRFSKLEREQGQAREDSIASRAQQGFENKLAERRVSTQEERTKILGRPKVGGGAASRKEQTRLDEKDLERWEDHFQNVLGFETDPGKVRLFAKTAQLLERTGRLRNTDLTVLEAVELALRAPDKDTDVDLGKTDKEVTGLTPGARTPSAVRGAGETPEDFTVRQEKQKVTETARVETLGAQDEIRRLETDTANRQSQVGDFVKAEIESGRRTEEEIAELLVQRGFTDPVSLDFLLNTYPGLWDKVTEKLTNG